MYEEKKEVEVHEDNEDDDLHILEVPELGFAKSGMHSNAELT